MSDLYNHGTGDVLVSRPSDGVLLITINRPERYNSLTMPMFDELSEIWADVERDDQTRAPFALRLSDAPAYEAVRTRYRKIFAGSDFMQWLIDRNSLVERGEATTGCLVCYFESRWKHVGVCTVGARVTSKWGTYPLYEHELAEVPDLYGDCVRFFERPSRTEALSLFRTYALQFLSAQEFDNA